MSYLLPFLSKKIEGYHNLTPIALNKELENYQLWLPVFIAFGILIFFALPFDPSIWLSSAILVISIIAYLVIRSYDTLRIFSCFLIAFALGFNSMQLRVLTINSPILSTPLSKVTVVGLVEEAAKTEKGYRLLINNVKIYGYKGPLPKLIRMSTNLDISEIMIGDTIKAYADLMPPPKPTMPEGFDYAEYAYFKQIGAIGYTIGKIKKVESDLGTNSFNINIWRDKIAQRIKANMSLRSAGIAEGMLIGNIGAINKLDYEAIRIAGLAHIIAISGMHIVVVVGLVFISVRF